MATIDESTVKEIAAAVAAQIPNHPNWLENLIAFVILTAMAASGAYWAARFAERGKQAAIDARFDQMLRELGHTTRAVEEVKAEFNDKATLEKLYRDKLEEILAAVFDLEGWYDVRRYSAIDNGEILLSGGPLQIVGKLSKLYFNDCDGQFLALHQACLDFNRWILDTKGESLAAAHENRLSNIDLNAYGAVYVSFSNASGAYVDALAAAYGERAGLPGYANGQQPPGAQLKAAIAEALKPGVDG